MVCVTCKVAGMKFNSLDEIFKIQVLKKTKSIRMDDSHPLNKFSFVLLSIRDINTTEKRT